MGVHHVRHHHSSDRGGAEERAADHLGGGSGRRSRLGDPKDPAFAPAEWPQFELGLEPPSSEQVSLTTLDGEPHRKVRAAHAPLFTAKAIRALAPRVEEIACELIAEPDFAARYPLAVICELLELPVAHLDELVVGCRQLADFTDVGAGMATLIRLAGAAKAPGLRARLPEPDYLIFGLLLAGQVTTEVALGFVIAHLLAGHQTGTDDEFVRQVLRRHPPAPFSLWRFTTAAVELGGHTLPPRSPVLVHIEAVNAQGHDLTFGAGPHYCIGAQLAQLELTTAVRVLKRDYPNARLTVPFEELTVVDTGVQGMRLASLPLELG
jgi:cytochrome P450